MLTDLALGIVERAVFLAVMKIDSYHKREDYLEACRAYNVLNSMREANRRACPWMA